jgi:hypothetical protein
MTVIKNQTFLLDVLAYESQKDYSFYSQLAPSTSKRKPHGIQPVAQKQTTCEEQVKKGI